MSILLDLGVDTTSLETLPQAKPEVDAELTKEQAQQLVGWYALGSAEFPYGEIERQGGRAEIAAKFGVKVEKVDEVIAECDALRSDVSVQNPV